MEFDSAAIQHRVYATVRPDQIDELDHVNNAEYLRFVEMAARSHAASVGLDFQGMLDRGGVFVVRRHTIQYIRPAREGDSLEIATCIGAMRAARALRHVWILKDGELMAEAEIEWVWIDPVTRRPKAMPESVAPAFNPIKTE